MIKIRRALVSVSDKTDIVDLCQFFHKLDIEIYSTGGTARLLKDKNIPVVEVSDYTKYPEMMDGRVKTLHPKIHGGILGRRGIDDDIMKKNGITPIDLVVVNLYPFTETVKETECTLANAIENIDIGGPTMIRAAAKNHESVAVCVNSFDYERLKKELDMNGGCLSDATRFEFAVSAFEHTAKYDGTIANYLGSIKADGEKEEYSNTLNYQFSKSQELRYGENPHQSAAFYTDSQSASGASISSSKQVQGKALSYNNIADTDAALECVKQYPAPACVIVKHANPCGVAQSATLLQAYELAYSTDPTSAFGGIIAFNRELDEEVAKEIINRQFVEVIVAPTITLAAKEILSSKPNIRVLACGELSGENEAHDLKRVTGGLLVQAKDNRVVLPDDLNIVTQRKPTPQELLDLLFAWKVAKFVKSNAIVYARDGRTIGVGAGQMSRVYSAKIAGIKASDEGLEVKGSVMASDAFFPFRDGIDAAANVGITAVIQPGGSMRDSEVIDAANEHDIAMAFTGVRHFRH